MFVNEGSEIPKIVSFGQENPQKLCTFQVCANEHTWPARVVVSKCVGLEGVQGCGTDVLAIRMENCPVCNDPPVKVELRADIVPVVNGAAAPLLPVCRGKHSPSVDHINLHIERRVQ